MTSLPNQTPYLHLDLGTDAAENRNWALIDTRLWQVAARMVGDLIGPGMITLEMLDPAIVERLLPVPFGNPNDLLMLNSNGTPVWAPQSVAGQLWLDTGANLQPSLALGGSYPVSFGPLTLMAPPGGEPSLLRSALPQESIAQGTALYRHDVLPPLSQVPAFEELLSASEAWTGSQGTTWSISTTPNGLSSTQFRLLIDGSGYTVFPNTKGVEIGGSILPTFEMLQVQGAIVIGGSTNASPVDGTLQYAGGKFQGHASGAWVDIPGATGGTNFWADDGSTLTPINPRAVQIAAMQGYYGDTQFFVGTPTGVQFTFMGQSGSEHIQVGAGLRLWASFAPPPLTGMLQWNNATGHFQGHTGTAWIDLDTALGPAGGDLAGSTYPNPIITAGAVSRAKTAPDLWLPPIPVGGNVGQYLGVASGPTLAWQPIVAVPVWTAPVTWTTTTGTVATTQYENQISATLNGVALTLPPWSSVPQGAVFRFTRTDATPANQVSIAAAGTDTIDYASFITIAPGECVTIIAANSGTNNMRWFTTGRSAWVTRQAGNVIIPTDSFKVINAGSVGDAFVWPARTIRGRLIGAKVADANALAGLTLNWSYAGATLAVDSTVEPSWTVKVTGGSVDRFAIDRAPATSGTPTFVNLLALDNAGQVSLFGVGSTALNALQWGSQTGKGRLTSGNASPYVEFSVNRTVTNTQDDATRPSWFLGLDAGAPDHLQVTRCAAGNTASQLIAMTLDNLGTLTLPGDPATSARIVLNGSGAATSRARVQSINSTAASWLAMSINRDPATGAIDDSTRSAWQFTLNQSDSAGIARQGAGGGFISLLGVDSAGNTSHAGRVTGGPLTGGNIWQVQSSPMPASFTISTPYNTWVSVVSRTITTRGGYVLILINSGFSSVWGASTSWYMQVTRDGGSIFYNRWLGTATHALPGIYGIDLPSAGAHTYTLQCYLSAGAVQTQADFVGMMWTIEFG